MSRMTEPRSFDAIADDLVAELREALAPFAHLSDAEIMARPGLTPPEARLVINTRRAVERYDADDTIGAVVVQNGEVRAVATPRKP